jgi:hypothetical protein
LPTKRDVRAFVQSQGEDMKSCLGDDGALEAAQIGTFPVLNPFTDLSSRYFQTLPDIVRT